MRIASGFASLTAPLVTFWVDIDVHELFQESIQRVSKQWVRREIEKEEDENASHFWKEWFLAPT